MQDKSYLYLKAALVLWVLFVQEPGTAAATQLDQAPQTQCCGMRSLRELFRTPALDSPDSFAPPTSLHPNDQ